MPSVTLSARPVVLPSEASEFAAELRQIFLEMARTPGSGVLSGECSPLLDVFETDDRLEIAVDLPAVDAGRIRVVVKGSAVLIAGEKTPRRSQGDSGFHLVERGYGRFARVVRLGEACDTGGAQAVLSDGELRITLPKVAERRGRSRRVPIADRQPIA